MSELAFPEVAHPLTLSAKSARDLMTANPVSLRDAATIREAIAFLIDKNIGGAPVIDEAGRPVGVLSQHDIVVHDRETVHYANTDHEWVTPGSALAKHLDDDFQIENVDQTEARDMMTPVIFSVRLDTPACKVIEEMLALKVHRLFVVDDNGVLVGVITALDVLRHLHF
ncbi:MAG TPA: CBS domain-containing protein [Gemmataceae bacterium]|jgi:predicted transcriptional regulator